MRLNSLNLLVVALLMVLDTILHVSAGKTARRTFVEVTPASADSPDSAEARYRAVWHVHHISVHRRCFLNGSFPTLLSYSRVLAGL